MKFFKALWIILPVLLFSHPVLADTYCKDIKDAPTRINITMTMPDPDFNFQKSHEQLTAKNRDTLFNKWANTKEKQAWIENGYVAGLARGGSGFEAKMNLHGIRYGERGGDYCPFFREIDIELYYGTVIFIANDFKEGSCRFKSIMTHEMKHHNTNQRVARKYAAKLEHDLPQMIAEIEGLGYVHWDQTDARFKFMQQSMSDAIDIYGQAMNEEMTAENAKIDTLEEYKANQAECENKPD